MLFKWASQLLIKFKQLLSKKDRKWVCIQNIPNPFEQSTEIRYEVPQTAKQISLYIYDLKGNELLQFNNLKAGMGAVLIEAHQLKAGMYLYSLIVDGQVQATKRMILTNSLR